MMKPKNPISFCFCKPENESELLSLKEKIENFYQTNSFYPAFENETHKPEYWEAIKSAISDKTKINQKCLVLEFGAGKTGFSKFLGDIRKNVHFEVQDVTCLNKDYLSEVADEVIIGPINSITKSYDIIFSTFVLEHIINPEETLKHLLKLLKPGGSMFLVCPRYDFPFYLSNSSKHFSLIEKIKTGVWLILQRVKAVFLKKPSFIIHLDPAVFHVPFQRDVDAIHWVSFFDLKYSLPDNFSIKKIFTNSQKTLKGKFWEKFLLMNVQIQKDNE